MQNAIYCSLSPLFRICGSVFSLWCGSGSDFSLRLGSDLRLRCRSRSSSKWCESATTVYRPSTAPFLSIYAFIRSYTVPFWASTALGFRLWYRSGSFFDFDPAFHSDADPYTVYQNISDWSCATLSCRYEAQNRKASFTCSFYYNSLDTF
jgi:hypothetical protein